MKLLVASGVLLLSLALSGCTGGGGSDGDSFVTPEQDDAGRYIIRMENFKFVPAQAEVPAGATVVWMNEEGSHNVVPEGHSEWQATSPSAAQGDHLEVTLDTPGTYAYFCQPHQSMGMEASIRVV